MKHKQLTIAVITVLITILLEPFNTVQAEYKIPMNQISFRAGISYFNLDPNLPRDLVIHETHPDDLAFLTGDAGSTDLDEVEIRTLDLSLEWSRVSKHTPQLRYLFNYTLKIPSDETGREDRQHASDIRPPTSGSFEYTQINEVDLAHELGIGAEVWRYVWGGLRFGVRGMVSVGYWSMEFEKGWNRFGADEMALRSKADGLSFFPQLGFSLGGEKMRIELTAGHRFINLDYDASSLDSDTGSGWEIGALVNFVLKEW